jgi:hypothetical protein
VAERSWCTSKVIADNGTESWRDDVKVIVTNVAVELGTLTTTELSDLHQEERLFVDPSCTNGVWPVNPRPLT